MYPDEQAATLAAGKEVTKTQTTNGWTIKTNRAPILSVAKRSLAADSQVAWKRELGLGRATNQELPEALYGRNRLALRHGSCHNFLFRRIPTLLVAIGLQETVQQPRQRFTEVIVLSRQELAHLGPHEIYRRK